MRYSLYLVKEGTRGHDWEVNLKLEIDCDVPPIELAEFEGGQATLFDGYTTKTSTYLLTSSQRDARRIDFLKDEAVVATLNPVLERLVKPLDPLNTLKALPLRNEQILTLHWKQEPENYLVTGASWGLR